MITTEDLLNFAQENGLNVHPTNPLDQHVERVNTGNGACPCDPEHRTCPCEEAISDCNDTTKPEKERCCTCRVFVSTDYVDAWGYGSTPNKKSKGKKTIVTAQPILDDDVVPVQSADSEVPKEVFDQSMKIVATVKHAKGMLNKDPAQASEYLMSAIDELGCPTCEAYFVASALKAQAAAVMCTSGGEEDCKIAQREAETGLERIIDLYQKVAGVTPSVSPTKPADKRRACISQNIKSDAVNGAIDAFHITDPKAIRNIRFFITTKMCSSNPITVEEGIELAQTTHPEWFIGAKK